MVDVQHLKNDFSLELSEGRASDSLYHDFLVGHCRKLQFSKDILQSSRLEINSCIRPCYRMFIKYCVFSKILKYIPDSGLSRFPLGGVSVCTQWQAKPPALQQNWQSSEKSQHFKIFEKTQYLINTLYMSFVFKSS